MAADSVGSLARVPAGPGRRRDPSIDERLRRAARTLYAREGWAGFHFEGIARTAGVSKDAVYRRYPDAQALLLDALSDQSVPRLAEDGPIEEALIDFACAAFSYFAGGDGYANLRVHLDARQYPEILEQYRVRVLEPQMEQAIGVLQRARDNGELHPESFLRGGVRSTRRRDHVLRIVLAANGFRSGPPRPRYRAATDRMRPADPARAADRSV